ncbi:MAG: hypothetical protein NT069_02775 [Planctomycetota bacterium]|nr:hypothetical protein [Planctomycetota bacterium]
MKTLLPVIFGLLTALFWGLYGPVLGESRGDLKSPFKPYLLIGLAYLLWGVGGGLVGMWQKGDNFSFPAGGTTLGFIAGSLGAFGALTLTLAMYNGGKPHIVMPIVFGGAVTVSTLVSVIKEYKEKGHTEANPWILGAGILGVVISAALVASCTPHAAPPGPKKPDGAAPATTGTPTPNAGEESLS